MDELSRQIEAARDHVRVEWEADHAALVVVGMHRKARRRRIVKASSAAMALLVAGVAGSMLAPNAPEPTPVSAKSIARVAPAPVVAPKLEPMLAPSSKLVRLADGSTIEPLERARVSFRELSAELVVVELDEGESRFEVAPRPERSFVVSAGGVRVTVVGTAFSVRRESTRTRVSVERGKVRVEHEGKETFLNAGDSAWFGTEAKAPVEAPSARQASKRAPAAAKTWRTLAETGDYRAAYEVMPPETKIRDEPAELLAAADVARLSDHAAEAVPFLERLLERHADDPRAPLAAFTLGRVLLAGRPEAAAQAFERARLLDPTGSLSEDALAREAEAWSRAGDPALARARAESYIARYPRGRRLGEVEKHLQ